MTEPKRLGRYEVLRPLAQGGMAELFLARATGIEGFEKLVVIKRILPELVRDGEYKAMFLEEARIAAALHHSNIVQAYDIGEADGAPFFAMEYLQGHDVRTIMRALHRQGARVPVEHALSIAIGIAAGLHYAHRLRDADGKPLGLVHRDVSPTNIAVTFEGGVKLLDFGVAKTRRQRSVTRHGTLKGKLGYMSPEQCAGGELDGRSDVFAVAIVLWELVTGRRLYGGRSDFGVMKSIAEVDAPRPTVVWPECPPELDAIIMRGLVRERDGRWQTAEELQLALEAFARERRLAVSGVGLGKWARAVAGGASDEMAPIERTTSLYDSAPDDDAHDATIVDGVVAPVPAATPKRKTRVARVGRKRRWPWLAALPLVAVVAVGGWRLATRKHEQVAPATTPMPTPPAAAAPELPVAVPPPTATEPPATEPPPKAETKPMTSHAHKRSRPPHRKPSTRVDLDAPLPPR